MNYEEIIKKLETLKNPKNVAGMARFGIRPKAKVYGVSIPEVRKIAKNIKKDHELALKLWNSKIHEAKILASIIAVPEKMTLEKIEKWVKDFDSWDICDQTCMNLFSKTEKAKKQIIKFSKNKKEFIKRTAFALMAALAVHDKKMKDKDFLKFFYLIKRESIDERNFVKKSVNWALRQIGKRNKNLNKKALKLAMEIKKNNSKSAKWIANNAISELTNKNILKRLK